MKRTMRNPAVLMAVMAGIEIHAVEVEIRPGKASAAQADAFREDCLVMRLLRDGEHIDSVHFVSSYGSAEAQTVKRGGREFVLLRLGRGRATNPRHEFLRVYLVGERANLLLEVPISGPAGATARWEYRVSASTALSGALILDRERHLEGTAPSVFPASATRRVTVTGCRRLTGDVSGDGQ